MAGNDPIPDPITGDVRCDAVTEISNFYEDVDFTSSLGIIEYFIIWGLFFALSIVFYGQIDY